MWNLLAYFKLIRITRLKKNKTGNKKNSLSQSDNEFSIGEYRKEFYPSLLTQREFYVKLYKFYFYPTNNMQAKGRGNITLNQI